MDVARAVRARRPSDWANKGPGVRGMEDRMKELESYQLGEEVPFSEILAQLLAGDALIFSAERKATGERWEVRGNGCSGFGDAPFFAKNEIALALLRVDAEFEITCRRKVYDPQAIQRARQEVTNSLLIQPSAKS